MNPPTFSSSSCGSSCSSSLSFFFFVRVPFSKFFLSKGSFVLFIAFGFFFFFFSASSFFPFPLFPTLLLTSLPLFGPEMILNSTSVHPPDVLFSSSSLIPVEDSCKRLLVLSLPEFISKSPSSSTTTASLFLDTSLELSLLLLLVLIVGSLLKFIPFSSSALSSSTSSSEDSSISSGSGFSSPSTGGVKSKLDSMSRCLSDMTAAFLCFAMSPVLSETLTNGREAFTTKTPVA